MVTRRVAGILCAGSDRIAESAAAGQEIVARRRIREVNEAAHIPFSRIVEAMDLTP